MARAEPYPSSQTTKSETKTSFRAPPPPPVGKDIGVAAGIAGIIGTIYFISRGRTAAAATPSAAASSSGAGSSSATASNTSPALGVPGAPSILTQVGATATSAILTTNQVSGATQYNAYEQNTNLLLAESPTNVIDIQGLQTNSGYEVYVRAQNSAGQLSPPSQPTLITTGAGSPVVIINQGTGTTTPSPSTTPSATVQPPSGQTLTVAANPAQPAVGDAVTITASSAALASYLSQVGTPVTVQWQWVVKTPSGSVAVNRTDASAASSDTISLAPNSAGSWTVQVTASTGGQLLTAAHVIGSGTLALGVIQPTQAASSTPLTTQNTKNVVTTTPSNLTLVPVGASGQSRLHTLQTAQAVSLPGLTGAQVGLLMGITRQYGGAIIGVLANGVISINPSSPQAVALIRYTSSLPGGPGHSFPGVSIPGQSSAAVAQVGTLAAQGRLKGLTPSGAPIT